MNNSNNRKNKKISKSANFSQQLYELRNIALTITKNNKISVKYDANQITSLYNPEKNEIILSLNPYPKYIVNQPLLAEKILDGDVAHECGHALLSLPIWSYINSWVTKIKRNRGSVALARQITNLTEDKRVNHFIILRYRFDFGKRLKFANLILKDAIETHIKENPPKINPMHGEAPIMLGILTNEGLYEADCSKLWQILSDSAKEDTKKALSILNDVTYKRLKKDIIKANQQIYDLIMKHLEKGADHSLKNFIPSRIRGGKIKIRISQALKEQLDNMIKAELKEQAKTEAEKLLEDLLKGEGAGEGTGEEIPAPEPDFAEYSRLLDRNKAEITRLLNKLKQLLKPIVSRHIFQKRGRIMPNLISKSYVASLRQEVNNVYLNFKSKFEREKVAIGFLFDFSASVNRIEALDITTILNEVFGHYVDDYGYAVACFGANSQKVKTFFETFENTKARVGNIGVNSAGTEISVLLTSFLKMFNAIGSERRKILVIASDFCFGDDLEASKLIKLFPLANVELIFIGFSNYQKALEWCPDLKNTRRTVIKSVKELPERFLDVYLNIQQ